MQVEVKKIIDSHFNVVYLRNKAVDLTYVKIQ